MTIWALHGFLGLPSDFEELKAQCLRLQPQLIWHSVNYLHQRELSSRNSLQEWGHQFNQFVQKSADPKEANILLGYSQGGRLALQALSENASLWKAAVLLSANPGILEGEKPLRLQNDQRWADQFLNEDFSRTLRLWNAQSVFDGSQREPQRSESDFNRRQLADCLLNWSVGLQQNFSTFLAKTTFPILYVAGARDNKYCQIGKALAQANRQVEFEALPASGHRVVFDQSSLLAEKIIQFLQKKTPDSFPSGV